MNSRRDADIRRTQAKPWRKLYATKRWRQLRIDHFERHPWCVICARFGRTRAARILDHVHRHNGDEQKFWAGPFQGLCKPCHDIVKQQQEEAGFAKTVDDDGWPADPAHPFNAGAKPSLETRQPWRSRSRARIRNQ